jgi:hypothetical protein
MVLFYLFASAGHLPTRFIYIYIYTLFLCIPTSGADYLVLIHVLLDGGGVQLPAAARYFPLYH